MEDSHCGFDRFLDDLQSRLEDYDTEDQDPRVRITIMMLMKVVEEHKMIDVGTGFSCDDTSPRKTDTMEQQSRRTDRKKNVVRSRSPIRLKTDKRSTKEAMCQVLEFQRYEACPTGYSEDNQHRDYPLRDVAK
jgi:hypothetical protein